MKIDLGYKKLMSEHKLSESDLSKKAKVGIAAIDAIIRGVNMAEKKAETKGTKYTPSASIMDKIEANDSWVCDAIADHLEGVNTTPAVVPNAAPDVIAQIAVEAPVATAAPTAPAATTATPAASTEPVITPTQALDPEPVPLAKAAVDYFNIFD